MTAAAALLLIGPLLTSDQWSISKGILLVMNPAETLSLFWYIVLVMFDGRIEFMTYNYALLWLVAGIMLCQYFA